MPVEKKILVTSFQSLTKDSAAGMARLGYLVSKELYTKGILKYFVVHSKGKFSTPFPSLPVTFSSRLLLFLLNKLNKLIKLPDHKFRLLQEHAYDIFCSAHIKRDIGVLFTTNAHLRRTFRKAKRYNITIVYVPANPEENYIYNLVTEENQKLGIQSTDPYTYRPRLDFYNQSIQYVDTVIGTYPTVYNTYKEANGNYEVLQINGHLKPDFQAYDLQPKSSGGVFKVIYIASTVALKGLQYLLEAWKLLTEATTDLPIKLYVVGKIDKTVQSHIDKHFIQLQKVNFVGRVPDVTAYLKDKDIAVVPSLTDGGPYVALEAAHYGLPVIITENCGSAELLSRGKGGCKIVPIRNPERIKEEILWAYNNREASIEMGRNAKEILDNYQPEEFVVEIANYLENRLKQQTS